MFKEKKKSRNEKENNSLCIYIISTITATGFLHSSIAIRQNRIMEKRRKQIDGEKRR